MMKRVLLVFLAGMVFNPVSVSAQADPFVGTWKLNLGKSKFTDQPAPRSETRIIEATSDGERVTIDEITPEGRHIDSQYTCGFDGKDCALGPGVAWTQGDTTARKRIDANTVESTVKRRGEVLYISRNVVSKDGKTMTLNAKGKDANGNSLESVEVFDKQ